ncbi:peptidase inhibitor family I36 protein [Kribbella sp. NBC_00382]|uniref:peptidase inhibitor family I36 protein n=1 Tax=Kribbella sp. NBC_00382 TaxID=2975967 RepID=UPI002E2237B5
MRSLTWKTAAFAAATLVATAAPVVPASAALGDCPSGYFCAWADDNAQGHRAQWAGDDSNWGDDGMHDNDETVYNNGTPGGYDHVWLYYDVNYGRYNMCVEPGEWYDAQLDDNDHDSHQWQTGCKFG